MDVIARESTQQCPHCGAFLVKPKPGDRIRICSRCGAEFEVPRPAEQLRGAVSALERIARMHPVDAGLRGGDVARAALEAMGAELTGLGGQ